MTNAYRKDFPLLMAQDIAYLDNAATAQRPQCVLDAVNRFYCEQNANPLRGLYPLSVAATDAYENARAAVRRFLNAGSTSEIVFTRNTTEGLNLAAYSYGLSHIRAGDEVVVSILEHHSDLLPWQMVCRQTGAKLRFIECEPDGSVDLAFVALPAEADSRCVPLYRDELVAVLPKGHRLCSLPVCPAAEIAKEPIISLLETSTHDVRRALDAVGAKPDLRFRTKDDYAVIAMVRQGLGVSIMPSLLLRGNNEGVELRPLDPPAYRTIALTMGSVETGPAARQFAEFARAWVKENA